jgi:ABC-type transporter Mla MlaB component
MTKLTGIHEIAHPGQAPGGHRSPESASSSLGSTPAIDEQRGEGTLMASNSFAGSAYRLVLVGELSFRNLDCLADELGRMETSGASETTVDVSGLNFIDSPGMTALAEAGNRFRSRDQHLRIHGKPRLFAQRRPWV